MNNTNFNQECLEAHNECRAKHGAAPLVLSQKVHISFLSGAKAIIINKSIAN